MSLILEQKQNAIRNSNIFLRRKILSSYKNRVTPLDYNFISFSSQDPYHPINSLIKALNPKNNDGWVSNRYCTYPQEFMIKFPTEVNIRQINILINESKIPKKIELINCIPIGKRNKFLMNGDKNINLIPSDFIYENIGFINFSSNAENKYQLRELRKIYININSEYLKFKIHRNHNNNLNIFCQVGIVALDIFGQKKEKKLRLKKISPMKEKNISNNSDEDSLFEICLNGEGLEEKDIDEKLDTKTNEKIKELNKEMDKKKQNEMYDECKFIKEQIDKIRKISLKMHILEEEKKESANRNDFDRAQELKADIQKVGKLLEFYSSNDYKYKEKEKSKNINNKSKFDTNNNTMNLSQNRIEDNKFLYMERKNEKINVSQSHQQQDLLALDLLDYDDVVIPTVKNKLKANNLSMNQSLFNNNIGNSFDSIDNSKDFDQPEIKPLEQLNDSFKSKYEILIKIVGEETIRKIFSKSMGYKKEGLKFLKEKIPEILNAKSDTDETNRYILLLMEIINIFLSNKHSSIVFEALDLFNSILTAIQEKSKQNKISYDFTITKRTLRKIKEKLNDISKLVREKTENLYYMMLDSDFCEYNLLLSELVEKETIYQFNKTIEVKKNNNNNNYSIYDIYNNNNSTIEDKSSNHLIITKMKIFLNALENFDESVKKSKTDKQRFPKEILGDFIIMNINHPNYEVREITKKVAILYINIFGNNILEKMNIYLDEKDIIKTEKELKKIYEKLKKEEKKNIDVSQSYEGIFLTNNNMKFPSRLNRKQLPPIAKRRPGYKLLLDNKQMLRSSSQPKFKLEPIRKNNKKKIKNSNSQKVIKKMK